MKKYLLLAVSFCAVMSFTFAADSTMTVVSTGVTSTGVITSVAQKSTMTPDQVKAQKEAMIKLLETQITELRAMKDQDIAGFRALVDRQRDQMQKLIDSKREEIKEMRDDHRDEMQTTIDAILKDTTLSDIQKKESIAKLRNENKDFKEEVKIKKEETKKEIKTVRDANKTERKNYLATQRQQRQKARDVNKVERKDLKKQDIQKNKTTEQDD